MDTAKYKTKLEDELKELTAELKTLGIHNPEVKEDWIATPMGVGTNEADPNVGADRVEDWDERRATLSNLEGRCNDVIKALKKIEAGTYGTCEVSGEAIEEDRLEVNPAARTCKAHLDTELPS